MMMAATGNRVWGVQDWVVSVFGLGLEALGFTSFWRGCAWQSSACRAKPGTV